MTTSNMKVVSYSDKPGENYHQTCSSMSFIASSGSLLYCHIYCMFSLSALINQRFPAAHSCFQNNAPDKSVVRTPASQQTADRQTK